MPTRAYFRSSVSATGYPYRTYDHSSTWSTSPRDAAKNLVLRANAMSRTVKTVQHYSAVRLGGGTERTAYKGTNRIHANPQSIDNAFNVGVTNRAYRKLVEAIRGGNKAELGVGIAQWRSSWSMIALRAVQITKLMSKAERQAKRENRRREALRRVYRARKGRVVATKLKPKDLLPVSSASIFLEGIFGWMPLLQDIHSAAKVLAGDVPGGWYSVSASETMFPQKSIDTQYKAQDLLLKLRVTQSCFVRCSNPNLWLLNQLGLINPAVVAWDAIPWSFLINEFINLNHVMASYTDFVGITLENASTTSRWDYTEVSIFQTPPGYDAMRETFSCRDHFKTRALGLTLPALRCRLPNVSMTSALIKLSLLTQQARRLT